MRYYGVGTKQFKEKVDGENVSSTKNVVIHLNEQTRHGAVAEAERAARREKIKLEGVYPLKTAVAGYNGIMSKGIKAQKAAAHAKQERAFKRKIAIGR